jgi:hypothetical protein
MPQSIFRLSEHGGLNVYAIPVNIRVLKLEGDLWYGNPVLYTTNRRAGKKDEEAERIFCSLDWNCISGCRKAGFGDGLVISCQGFTFELEPVWR